MRRLVALFLIAVLVLPAMMVLPSYAGTTNVNVGQADDVIIQKADDVEIGADDVVVNADTVVINLKDGARVIKGTVLRNLNLIVEGVLNKPTEELSIEIANILKTSKYNFGTVARNEYMLNGKGVAYSTSGNYDNTQKPGETVLSKEEYILGGDITLKSEILTEVSSAGVYQFESFPYVTTPIVSGSDTIIEMQEAVMMIYKALGKSQYKHTFYFSRYSAEPVIEIGKTPFMELVPDVFAGIDSSRYYTHVFSTRTNMQAYWVDAASDGLVYAADESSKTTPMTLGEICKLVYLKLDREGEPVLTEEELSMMLVAHGRNLPAYLKNEELLAVKHLVARGIAETAMDFKSDNASMDDVLKILSRAKSKDARLTFKNIDYPYIASAVKAGFSPTEMSVTAPVLENVKLSPTTSGLTTAPVYYDYFVLKSPGFEFLSASGKPASSVFVRSEATQKSAPLLGSSVESTVYFGQSYYYVKIPVLAKATVTLEGKSYFVLDSSSDTDVVESIYLEVGGGVYYHDTAADSLSKTQRMIFGQEFQTGVFWDKERDAARPKAISLKLGGATNQKKFLFSFFVKDIGKIKWDGVLIKEVKNKDGTPFLQEVKSAENVITSYTIPILADDPAKYILKHLSYASPVKTEEMVKAYVADGKTALVSLKWLQKKGLVASVVEIEKGKKWLISSNKENTIIDLTDPKRRFIVAGQTVTEVSEEDKSPFIVTDELSGDMLIDYRAVMNMAGDYFVLKDDNGNISLSVNDQARGATYGAPMSVSLYGLFGGGVTSVSIMEGNKNYVSVSDTYPTANWLVYKQRRLGQYKDTLLVFKPTTKELGKIEIQLDSKDRDAVNFLIQEYGIEKGDYTDIASYNLNDWIFEKGAASALASATDTYGLKQDKYTGKYYYQVPKLKDGYQLQAEYDKYMAGTAKSTTNKNVMYPLPLFAVPKIGTNRLPIVNEFKIIDANLNLLRKGDGVSLISEYPSALVNAALRPEFVDIPVVKGTSNQKVAAYDLIPALAGVQSKYYPYPKKSWSSASKGVVYYGSMLASLKEYEGASSVGYTLRVGTYDLLQIPKSLATANLQFAEVFRGASKSVYVYGLDSQFRLTQPTQTVDFDTIGYVSSLIASLKEKIPFDLDAYALADFMVALDDGLTLVNIFVLSIVPRIMLFFFLAFMVLALAVENKLIQWFASHVFDPFKVISLGYTSIEHVKTVNAWLTTFIAIVFLGVMSNTILQVIAWLLQFSQVLINM